MPIVRMVRFVYHYTLCGHTVYWFIPASYIAPSECIDKNDEVHASYDDHCCGACDAAAFHVWMSMRDLTK